MRAGPSPEQIRAMHALATPPRHLHHRGRAEGQPYPAALRALRDPGATAAARAVLRFLPGYRPTPLRPLPGIAGELGLQEVWAKDESARFGLGSFKALGGAYAVFRLLQDQVRSSVRDAVVGAGELMWGHFDDLVSRVTVAAASAGNHGKAVAWSARLLGCRCVIYLPEGTDAARVAAIEELGAEVIRFPGSYDDAVRQVAEDAAANGWWVISDTAYNGYTEVPLTVMQGYTVLAEETVEQWRGTKPPTHVFLQCGVGGLAAAVSAHLGQRWETERPRIVVVEPERAACMLETARAGRLASVAGPLETMMTCLACGESSTVAWEVLQREADDFLAISDSCALQAVQLLERAALVDPPIRTAPSGAAGLGALIAAVGHPSTRAALDLDADSRVLLIVSEGRPRPATGWQPRTGGGGDPTDGKTTSNLV